MRSLLVTLFMTGFTFSVFSQNDDLQRNASLKIYNLTTLERDYSPRFTDSLGNPYSNTYYNIQYLHPTIAYQWNNARGNGHEIELTSFRLGSSETNKWYYYSRNPAMLIPSAYKHTGAVVSLRYEYILYVKRDGDPKLIPSMGFGFNPYYMMDNFKPVTTSVFTETFQAIGARFFAIPRLNYEISDRVYLDLNFPISIYDYKFVFAESSNPVIPIEQRKSNSIESESFAPVFSARIGVGIRL